MLRLRKSLVQLLLLMTVAPPFIGAGQRPIPGPTPSAELFGYYRRYPDRYLRISDQSWVYDSQRQSAVHSLTLTNVATAPYYYIQMRFTYLSASGKRMHSRVVQVLEGISAFGKKRLEVKLKNLPKEPDQVLVTIESARIILY
jgi:hypothetical protein